MQIELSVEERERLDKEEIALGYWAKEKKFVYIVQCSEDDLLEEIKAMEIISTDKR